MEISAVLLCIGQILITIFIVRYENKREKSKNRRASYKGSLKGLEKQIKEHWGNTDIVVQQQNRGIAVAFAYVNHDGTITRVEALHYKKHTLSAQFASTLLKTKNWQPAAHKGSPYVEPVLLALAVNISTNDLLKMTADIRAEPSNNVLFNGLRIIPDFEKTGLFKQIFEQVNSYNNGGVCFTLHRMYNGEPFQMVSLEDWVKKKEESNTRISSNLDPTDTYPMFPGGEEECYKFINNNMKYPETVESDGITGMVYTEFVVNEDGSLSDIIILKGPGYGMDEETVRLIKAMPNWIPATHNGKPTQSLAILPVRFMPR